MWCTWSKPNVGVIWLWCDTKVLRRDVGVIWVWWIFDVHGMDRIWRAVTWKWWNNVGVTWVWHWRDVCNLYHVTSLSYIIAYYVSVTPISSHMTLISHHNRKRPCDVYIRYIRLISNAYHHISHRYQITSVPYQFTFISHYTSRPYDRTSHTYHVI